MVRAAVLSLFFALLVIPSLAAPARKPRLVVRASPSLAFPPARVLVTAELVGGEDDEDLYCPELEWDWADGSRSVQQSDCAPAADGPEETWVERRFSARHRFSVPGQYWVALRLRAEGRVVTEGGATVLIHGPSED
jgi:hypothetical protein